MFVYYFCIIFYLFSLNSLFGSDCDDSFEQPPKKESRSRFRIADFSKDLLLRPKGEDVGTVFNNAGDLVVHKEKRRTTYVSIERVWKKLIKKSKEGSFEFRVLDYVFPFAKYRVMEDVLKSIGMQEPKIHSNLADYQDEFILHFFETVKNSYPELGKVIAHHSNEFDTAVKLVSERLKRYPMVDLAGKPDVRIEEPVWVNLVSSDPINPGGKRFLGLIMTDQGTGISMVFGFYVQESRVDLVEKIYDSYTEADPWW